jgi:hypothetical protein
VAVAAVCTSPVGAVGGWVSTDDEPVGEGVEDAPVEGGVDPVETMPAEVTDPDGLDPGEVDEDLDAQGAVLPVTEPCPERLPARSIAATERS